jgi:hypothetical protein
LTNFRVKGSVGRLQIKAADGGLALYSRRGDWKGGTPLTALDRMGDAYFHVGEDHLDPTGLTFIRGPDGAVTGLRYGLVEMFRTDAVPGWA